MRAAGNNQTRRSLNTGDKRIIHKNIGARALWSITSQDGNMGMQTLSTIGKGAEGQSDGK